MGYKLKAALRTTLVPEVGPLPTFTRNLAAYVSDFEGNLKLVPANCARFGGARFVQNIVTNSNFNNAGTNHAPTGWVNTGNAGFAPLGGYVIPNTFGATNAVSVRETAAGGFQGFQQPQAWVLNVPYRIHARLLVPAGVTPSNATVYFGTAAPSSVTLATAAQLAAQPADTWVWYSVLVTFTSSTTNALCFINPGAATGTGFDIAAPMVELCAGQSNTNPSDYIGTGLLAFPYYGSGADGCAFYDYLNGNTVAAGVVSAAKGAAIAAATLKRYRKEKASQNLLLQANALGTTPWGTLVTGNGVLPVVTNNAATAPDGSLTASKIAFTGFSGSGSAIVRQAVAGLANPTTLAPSIWLRADTPCSINLRQGDGIAGYVTVNITTAWQRFKPTPGSNAATSFNFDVTANITTGTVNVYAWESQLEPGTTVVTSEIPTAAAAVTRPRDLILWPLSIFSDVEGTCYATAEADDWGADVNNRRVIGDGAGGAGAPLFAYSAGAFRTYDLSTASPAGATVPAGKMQGAATWSSSGKQAFTNGVRIPGASTYDGSYNLASVTLGEGGGFPFQGYIGDVVILDTALSEFDVPSLPNYDYPRVAAALTCAVMTPTPLTCAVLYPTALVGIVPQPASLTGSA